MSEKRSLYQCFKARVKADNIYCAAGHRLSSRHNGTMGVKALVRGDPLEVAACQGCGDYDKMGPPIPPEERGWLWREAAEMLTEIQTRGRPRK